MVHFNNNNSRNDQLVIDLNSQPSPTCRCCHQFFQQSKIKECGTFLCEECVNNSIILLGKVIFTNQQSHGNQFNDYDTDAYDSDYCYQGSDYEWDEEY